MAGDGSTLGVSLRHERLEVRGTSIAASWITPAAIRGTRCIVYLHEGLGSVRQWKEFPARLCAATGLSGFVFDRLGHGRSGPLAAPRAPHYLQEEGEGWLPEVLGAAGITDPVPFGHSDGGSIALYYAASHPVAALVVEAAHAFVEELALSGIRQLGAEWHPSGMAQRSARSHGPKTEALFRAWHDTWLSVPFRDFNLLDRLPRISCPALVLQGDADPYGTPAQVEAIARGIRGPAQRWLVPGAGHAPHLTCEDAVVEKVACFLRDVLR
jgi:pimeloyl-ACP methyl ester carboxylesterase